MSKTVVCLAGPSAVGKSSVIEQVVALTNAEQAYSLTTRALRGANDHRIHVSKDEFDRRKNAGEFIEHISYNGHEYAISKSVVNAILQKGKVAILDCDEAGVIQILKAGLDAQVITIFLVCTAGQLYARQMQRDGTGLTAAAKIWRMRTSRIEIEGCEKKHIFQYVIDNSNLQEAAEKIVRIIEDDPSVKSDSFSMISFKEEMTKTLTELNNQFKEEW